MLQYFRARKTHAAAEEPDPVERLERGRLGPQGGARVGGSGSGSTRRAVVRADLLILPVSAEAPATTSDRSGAEALNLLVELGRDLEKALGSRLRTRLRNDCRGSRAALRILRILLIPVGVDEIVPGARAGSRRVVLRFPHGELSHDFFW